MDIIMRKFLLFILMLFFCLPVVTWAQDPVIKIKTHLGDARAPEVEFDFDVTSLLVYRGEYFKGFVSAQIRLQVDQLIAADDADFYTFGVDKDKIGDWKKQIIQKILESGIVDKVEAEVNQYIQKQEKDLGFNERVHDERDYGQKEEAFTIQHTNLPNQPTEKIYIVRVRGSEGFDFVREDGSNFPRKLLLSPPPAMVINYSEKGFVRNMLSAGPGLPADQQVHYSPLGFYYNGSGKIIPRKDALLKLGAMDPEKEFSSPEFQLKAHLKHWDESLLLPTKSKKAYALLSLGNKSSEVLFFDPVNGTYAGNLRDKASELDWSGWPVISCGNVKYTTIKMGRQVFLQRQGKGVAFVDDGDDDDDLEASSLFSMADLEKKCPFPDHFKIETNFVKKALKKKKKPKKEATLFNYEVQGQDRIVWLETLGTPPKTINIYTDEDGHVYSYEQLFEDEDATKRARFQTDPVSLDGNFERMLDADPGQAEYLWGDYNNGLLFETVGKHAVSFVSFTEWNPELRLKLKPAQKKKLGKNPDLVKMIDGKEVGLLLIKEGPYRGKWVDKHGKTYHPTAYSSGAVFQASQIMPHFDSQNPYAHFKDDKNNLYIYDKRGFYAVRKDGEKIYTSMSVEEVRARVDSKGADKIIVKQILNRPNAAPLMMVDTDEGQQYLRVSSMQPFEGYYYNNNGKLYPPSIIEDAEEYLTPKEKSTDTELDSGQRIQFIDHDDKEYEAYYSKKYASFLKKKGENDRYEIHEPIPFLQILKGLKTEELVPKFKSADGQHLIYELPYPISDAVSDNGYHTVVIPKKMLQKQADGRFAPVTDAQLQTAVDLYPTLRIPIELSKTTPLYQIEPTLISRGSKRRAIRMENDHVEMFMSGHNQSDDPLELVVDGHELAKHIAKRKYTPEQITEIFNDPKKSKDFLYEVILNGDDTLDYSTNNLDPSQHGPMVRLITRNSRHTFLMKATDLNKQKYLEQFLANETFRFQLLHTLTQEILSRTDQHLGKSPDDEDDKEKEIRESIATLRRTYLEDPEQNTACVGCTFSGDLKKIGELYTDILGIYEKIPKVKAAEADDDEDEAEAVAAQRTHKIYFQQLCVLEKFASACKKDIGIRILEEIASIKDKNKESFEGLDCENDELPVINKGASGHGSGKPHTSAGANGGNSGGGFNPLDDDDELDDIPDHNSEADQDELDDLNAPDPDGDKTDNESDNGDDDDASASGKDKHKGKGHKKKKKGVGGDDAEDEDEEEDDVSSQSSGSSSKSKAGGIGGDGSGGSGGASANPSAGNSPSPSLDTTPASPAKQNNSLDMSGMFMAMAMMGQGGHSGPNMGYSPLDQYLMMSAFSGGIGGGFGGGIPAVIY